jgi:hypothetical protein
MTFKKTATILLLTAAVVGPAFAKKDKAKDKPETAPVVAAPAAASAGSDERPAATVGGAVITMDEVDRAASSQLMKIRQQEYQARVDTLESLIQQKLVTDEAAARKVTDADLIKTEIIDKTQAPTADEVSQYYEKMKARMGGKTLDEVKGDIEKRSPSRSRTSAALSSCRSWRRRAT